MTEPDQWQSIRASFQDSMEPHRADVPLLQPQSAEQERAHRKLLAAGLIGSSIEWYDFFLYGTAAALVFPQVFFPGCLAANGDVVYRSAPSGRVS